MGKEQRASDEDKLRYYAFWLWEYQRRNEDYIRDYNNYVEKTGGVWEDPYTHLKADNLLSPIKVPYQQHDILKEFYEKHGRIPADPKDNIREGRNRPSKEILYDFVKESFEIKYGKTLELYDILIFQLKNRKMASKTTMRSNVKDNSFKLNIEIDLSKPYEQIILEVDYWYNLFHLGLNPQYLLFDDKNSSEEKNISSKNKQIQKLSESFFKLLEYFRIEDNQRINIKDRARFIGLWLWDTVKFKYTNIEDKIDWNEISEEYENLVIDINEELNEELKVKLNREDSRLKTYYKNTKKCIEEVNFFPMTKV